MSAVTVEQDGICPEHGKDYIELVSMSPDGSGCDYICWECWHKDREDAEYEGPEQTHPETITFRTVEFEKVFALLEGGGE